MKQIAVITEVLGTFGLMLTIQLSMIYAPDHVAYVVGAGLALLVYAGFRFSGAQYNPAVTILMLVTGNIDTWRALVFITAQFIGSALALWTTEWIAGSYIPITFPGDLGDAFALRS